MTAIERIRAAQGTRLVDEDGNAVQFKLASPLTAADIDMVQKNLGQPLPEELRSLLGFCGGIEGCLEDGIDFSGANMQFGQEEIFPYGLPIAGDGCGNFWVVDITPRTTQVAPVFFACHDAPVILYQSPDLSSFLEQAFQLYTPPNTSLIKDVSSDRICEVWKKNPGVIGQAGAVVSPDPVMKAFALGLPEHFQIVDLRNVQPGMGFSWGRYGPKTEVRRHGIERIFAYGKPAGGGLFAKLFGRSV